jgi:ABC-type polysaccharide/polyol phosphate transport system ATPase subunit
MTNAIELHGVGKRYTQTQQSDDLLYKRLLQLGRRRGRVPLWALRDIDLDVAKGETIGIIGRNGSGKTTLLRMLSGVSAPTVGQVRVVGRIAPLIGIGVGFNQELTGRENVLTNGRLLGMTEAEVRKNFDAIVEFSEIEQFIDTPVKFYSSGMFLRLAFSVAIHTTPDVFILDEILAVGDMAFQLKCMTRMREIQAAGTTIVIVTHNLHTLDRIAPRAVLLSHGKLVYDGPTEQAIGKMHEVMQQETRERGGRADLMLQEGNSRTFVGGAEVVLDLVDQKGAHQRSFATGDKMVVRVDVVFEEEVTNPILGVMVAPVGLGAPAYTTFTERGAYKGKHGPGRPLEAEITLDVKLLAGGYTITAAIHDGDGEVTMGTTQPEAFYVSSVGINAGGLVNMAAEIAVNGKPVKAPPRKRLASAPRPATRQRTSRTSRTQS